MENGFVHQRVLDVVFCVAPSSAVHGVIEHTAPAGIRLCAEPRMAMIAGHPRMGRKTPQAATRPHFFVRSALVFSLPKCLRMMPLYSQNFHSNSSAFTRCPWLRLYIEANCELKLTFYPSFSVVQHAGVRISTRRLSILGRPLIAAAVR